MLPVIIIVEEEKFPLSFQKSQAKQHLQSNAHGDVGVNICHEPGLAHTKNTIASYFNDRETKSIAPAPCQTILNEWGHCPLIPPFEPPFKQTVRRGTCIENNEDRQLSCQDDIHIVT